VVLSGIWALCGAVPLSSGLLLGLFLAGAAGSAMHCVPMCGGFVLGQVADRMARVPAARLCEWRRVRGGALLPYHAGRLTTYAGLGAASGLIGATLARLPWFGFASAALLLLGAALFLAQAVRRMVPAMAHVLPALNGAPSAWNRAVAVLAARTGDNGYLLGLALGFLPCGFLYAALATSAASGSPLWGALAMLAFGAGTAPALVALGVVGQVAGRRWQRGVTLAAPAVMLLNAVLLVALALRGLAAGV
jgi:uncharacterized protein